MTSVESILQYTDLEREQLEEAGVQGDKPLDSWPSSGALIFRDVCLSYSETAPPVLRNINLDIQHGEKVDSFLSEYYL